MVYISTNDLNQCIKNNLNKLPKDIDLIVANPRSGILPAIMISLLLNVPICDISVFETNNIYSCGITKKVSHINSLSDARRILIVEDSSYSGNSINYIKSLIPKKLKEKSSILSVYVNEVTKELPNIYFEEINQSRIFEWNLFHHKYLNYAGIEFNILFNGTNNIIKPTQEIDTIILCDDMGKENVKKLLDINNIKYKNINYYDEISNEVKFIICKNKKMYNKDIFTIEY